MWLRMAPAIQTAIRTAPSLAVLGIRNNRTNTVSTVPAPSRNTRQAFLNQAKRSEGRNRSAAEHNAEKVHSQHDARNRDADCQKEERSFKARIEVANHQRNGEGRHGVA